MDYFFTQSRVIVTYIRLLFFPIGQRLDYDYELNESLFDIEVAASFALHIFLMALAATLYFRSKTKSDNSYLQRLIVIGIAWFYIALSVTSSFIPITDVIMEQRVYLPSAGFFIVIAAIFEMLGKKFQSVLRYRWLVLASVCLVLSGMTLQRNHVWGDELRFWRNEAKLSPESGRVFANLGFEYFERNNYEQAVRCLVEALNQEPNLSEAWIVLNDVIEEMGLYQGRFASNDQFLTEGNDIDYKHYTKFYTNEFNTMGLATEYLGKPEEAFKWYKKSLTLNPNFDLALFNIGLLSTRLGIAGNAELAIGKLKGLNPSLADKLERAVMSANIKR
jgi:tetratricopeptide (TPR) repeat protein